MKIIFARRGGLSTDDFKNYLRLLKDADDPTINIHWPVIDIDGIEAHDQPARFGLQLADIAVSGLTWALGSGLIDQSQKMTIAAMEIADMKVWAQRS